MMLKRKVYGLFLSPNKDLTISQIASYTNQKDYVILKVINQLIKEGKIEWSS